MTSRRRMLIVEPDLWAHHAFWLSLVIKGGLALGRDVEVLTQPADSQLSEQLRLQSVDVSKVVFHEINGQIDAGLLLQACELIANREFDLVFFPFLDRFLPLLAKSPSTWSGLRGKLSGIWFHPHALDSIWRWCPPLDKRSAVRSRLNRFFRSPAAAELFQACVLLDAVGVSRLREMNPRIRVELIADPYERESVLDRSTARARLGLPADRMLFLHLGSPEKRKGLPDVLAAFSRLKDTPIRPMLVRVGPNDRLGLKDRRRLDALVKADQAFVVNRFVPADDIMTYFKAADWILIPYRKFRFSSGILANAVGARRRIIASDYGHIGRVVADHSLGLVYRHGSALALERVLKRTLGMPAALELDDSSYRHQCSPDAWLASFIRIIS